MSAPGVCHSARPATSSLRWPSAHTLFKNLLLPRRYFESSGGKVLGRPYKRVIVCGASAMPRSALSSDLQKLGPLAQKWVPQSAECSA